MSFEDIDFEKVVAELKDLKLYPSLDKIAEIAGIPRERAFEFKKLLEESGVLLVHENVSQLWRWHDGTWTRGRSTVINNDIEILNDNRR